MKGDASEGNPMGFFQGRFKIDGIEKTFTTDYEVMTTEEFKKAEIKYGKKIFFKKVRQYGEAITIEYDDAFPTLLDKQKKNFCTELVKMPEMRTLDSPPSGTAHWTVEFGNEVTVRKASKLIKVIKILNILQGMKHRAMVNICFYFAPELRPDKRHPSELFTLLGDIRPDETGKPMGVLINSDYRMDAVLETYYKDTEESEFRTTVLKALEWNVIKSTPQGFYINDEFIGGDKEGVYVFLKNHPQIFNNFVLPAVSKQDALLMEDDLDKVKEIKWEIVNNVDRASKDIEDLRAEAYTLGIPRAKNYHDKAKIIGLIEAKIAEGVTANKIEVPQEV